MNTVCKVFIILLICFEDFCPIKWFYRMFMNIDFAVVRELHPYLTNDSIPIFSFSERRRVDFNGFKCSFIVYVIFVYLSWWLL